MGAMCEKQDDEKEEVKEEKVNEENLKTAAGSGGEEAPRLLLFLLNFRSRAPRFGVK